MIQFNKTGFLLSLLLVLATTLVSWGQAQNKTYLIGSEVINLLDKIDAEQINENALEQIIIDKINEVLSKRNKEVFQLNEILSKAAKDQSAYMANIDNISTIQITREKATTALRVERYGGSMRASEIVGKSSISKGKIPYTYGQVCEDLVFKLFNNSKKASLIAESGFNLAGIGVNTNLSKNKIYISIVLGNFKTINDGIAYKNKLPHPYTNKYYGLTAPRPTYCRKIEKLNNLHELQKGLVVENNTIYFESDNVKQLKKIIRKSKDALAVDILQREQFTCENPNIIDYNNLNRGILTKRVYSNKLFKKNIANTEDNRNAFKTALGDLPDGIRENYELNLVLIQNKSICKLVAPGFIIQTNGTYSRNVALLADTVTINTSYKYQPVADSMILTFKIPFENKKYTYKAEDIEPFLKLLNEPEFIIYDLNIKAYSSIEGTNKENRFLQEQRAKSIIQVLKKRQKENIANEIFTDYNWDDFKTDIIKTNHNIMASMSMEEAQKYIRQYNLKKELEPILQNHRYAEIKMKITYDISGSNEQPYVKKKFNDAITFGDRPLALAIQKFIIQQVLNNRYHVSILNDMIIPNESNYAGMEMNKLYVLNKFKQITTPEFIEKVAYLNQINPENEYIAFNNLLNTIHYSNYETLVSENTLIQNKLDRLYYTPLRKSTIDALNVKYQFKLINAADSSASNNKLKSASIEKIKDIVNIRKESMNNALKLAEIFIENNDYTFARKSLEPWVLKTSNEKVLFTYISLCSIDEWLMHTNKFTQSMKKASIVNKERFCELFNGTKFSLRVLENDEVKENYCQQCNDIDKVVQNENESDF